MSTVFLFTGQGSQFAGMGKDLAERSDAARATFAQADEALGESLSTLCFEGPDDELALTTNTQPATLTVAIAALRAAADHIGEPVAAAGHSLGEYGAHVAAGTFAFADAVRLVRERARRMQDAVPVGTGGMVVLRKADLAEAREVAARIAEKTGSVCDVANVNAPGQVVLSGGVEAMDALVEDLGRRALRLPVSVPFHSSLLRDASAGFAETLSGVAMNDPKFPIWCNVDAAAVRTADEARDALSRQFAGSVLWQASVENMLEQGFRRFVEFGPKPTLVKMVTQIASAASVDGVETVSVTSADELERLSAG
jgi:[acyl-carrier-protein] S-malonyltransferase